MKVELSAYNESDDFDCCIIGAGPAGITCALELAAAGKNILLLDGGEDEITEQSQNIYQGQVTGDPYFDLSMTRLRFFGGASNHWEGMCRTFDAHDFEDKGVFNTGWPISRSDIDIYLKKACSILEIDQFAADIPFADSGLNRVNYQFSPPVRFLEKYFDSVISHENITLILGANVTSLETTEGRISGAKIQSFSGNKKLVRAKIFIIATGGIENSRLLLWSNELSGGEVVKNADTLGRYWMEHPDFTIGAAIIDDGAFESEQRPESYFLAPSKNTIFENNTLNCGLRIEPDSYHGSKKLIADLACVAPELGRGLLRLFSKNLVCGYKLRASWEQEPVGENRITLGSDKDQFGIPRVDLHWRKNETDLRTVRQTALTLGKYLAKNNLGRVFLNPWVYGEDDYPGDEDVIAGNHHMGGTRMAASADRGVVDKNCKVFGQGNLYIAGSSVFPSGGYCNPTLPIIQLALRLCTHLQNKLSNI